MRFLDFFFISLRVKLLLFLLFKKNSRAFLIKIIHAQNLKSFRINSAPPLSPFSLAMTHASLKKRFFLFQGVI